MTPAELPTLHTAAFVTASIGAAARRILEVGCGAGEVAAELMRLGHTVIGLDPDEGAVALARKRGVDARRATWPVDWPAPESVDVLLFTRSLHHIAPLEPCVAHAAAALAPGGVLLIEDFAHDEATPAQAEWLFQTLALLHDCGALAGPPGAFFDQALALGDAAQAWRADHDHELHSWAQMTATIERHFMVVRTASAPYLYRYVAARLRPDATGHAQAQRVMDLESRSAAVAGAGLIGRRLVATAKRPLANMPGSRRR